MRRREFITLLGGAAAAWPLVARAQQSARQQRMAMFHPAIPPALLTETGGGSAWRAFFGFNLKTARAFALTLPPTLLARADEVIE